MRLLFISLVVVCILYSSPVSAAVGDRCALATPQTCGNGYVCTQLTDQKPTCQLDRCNSSCDYNKQICHLGTCVDIRGERDVTNTNAPASNGALLNPLGFDSLEDLLAAILRAVVQFGSMLLVLALVWVGFLFVFAQGNPEKVSSARQALLWTVIGGLLLLGAQSISMVIQNTVTGLN